MIWLLWQANIFFAIILKITILLTKQILEYIKIIHFINEKILSTNKFGCIVSIDIIKYMQIVEITSESIWSIIFKSKSQI